MGGFVEGNHVLVPDEVQEKILLFFSSFVHQIEFSITKIIDES